MLYRFTNGTDGGYPNGGLLIDVQGNLYGTTGAGGAYGLGVIFKLDPDGNETVLHDFDGAGANPRYGVTADGNGNFYGTTYESGGAVFKLDKNGVYSLVYIFESSDGALPNAGVTLDRNGNLYGTTSAGGDPICDCGVVFKITP